MRQRAREPETEIERQRQRDREHTYTLHLDSIPELCFGAVAVVGAVNVVALRSTGRPAAQVSHFAGQALVNIYTQTESQTPYTNRHSSISTHEQRVSNTIHQDAFVSICARTDTLKNLSLIHI